jgi:hypothetical protein
MLNTLYLAKRKSLSKLNCLKIKTNKLIRKQMKHMSRHFPKKGCTYGKCTNENKFIIACPLKPQ